MVLTGLGCQPAPLGRSDRAVSFNEVAAILMTVVSEAVVDRGVTGGEFPEGIEASEVRHRPVSSAKRQERVRRPVVEPSTAFLPVRQTDTFHRGAV